MAFDDEDEDEAGAAGGSQMFSILELIWGEGWSAPGGPEAVDRIVEGTDLRGKSVLDIGSGSGGVDFYLIEKHLAGHVTGVDANERAIEVARQHAGAKGISDKVEFLKAMRGALPFEDGCFDVAFSTDPLAHIADVAALMREVVRVLKSGGRFVASIGMAAGEGVPSAEHVRRALTDAGFVDVRLADLHEWYVTVARNELASMGGPIRNEAMRRFGDASVEQFTQRWEAMVGQLERGELQPTLVRARKP